MSDIDGMIVFCALAELMWWKGRKFFGVALGLIGFGHGLRYFMRAYDWTIFGWSFPT